MIKRQAVTVRKSLLKKKAQIKRLAKNKASKKPIKKKTIRKRVVKKISVVPKKPAKKKPSLTRVSVKHPVELTRHAEWSISQFSLNTGFQRETIRKRFADAAVKSTSKFRGYPLYRPIDGLQILYQTVDGVVDPDKLKPFERRAYYQGELDKLKLQAERGELVPSFESEREQSRVIKILVQHLDTLPDVLERDVGMTPKQLVRVEQVVDETREAMYRDVIGGEDADSATEKRV